MIMTMIVWGAEGERSIVSDLIRKCNGAHSFMAGKVDDEGKRDVRMIVRFLELLNCVEGGRRHRRKRNE